MKGLNLMWHDRARTGSYLLGHRSIPEQPFHFFALIMTLVLIDLHGVFVHLQCGGGGWSDIGRKIFNMCDVG